jgi:hypothetical protein
MANTPPARAVLDILIRFNTQKVKNSRGDAENAQKSAKIFRLRAERGCPPHEPFAHSTTKAGTRRSMLEFIETSGRDSLSPQRGEGWGEG